MCKVHPIGYLLYSLPLGHRLTIGLSGSSVDLLLLGWPNLCIRLNQEPITP